MTVRTLEIRRETHPLARPFRITGKEWTALEAVLCIIHEGSLSGRGECAGIFYFGETQDTMVAQIESVRDAIERGMTRHALLEALPSGGARNAIDCALWDLEAQQSQQSIWALTGLTPKPLITVATVSILDSAEAMAERAAQLAAYPLLKVKLDGHQPVERIEAIRRARGDATIVIDANQGFTIELLKEVLPYFVKADIAMIEQPLPRGEDAALEGLASAIPICADESVLDRTELGPAQSRYQMINIKLDKAGGLTEALLLQQAIHDAGLASMVGNMFGTSLAMAPAFVVGQGAQFVDLDGPLHLTEDRFDGLEFQEAAIHWTDRLPWGQGRQA